MKFYSTDTDVEQMCRGRVGRPTVFQNFQSTDPLGIARRVRTHIFKLNQSICQIFFRGDPKRRFARLRFAGHHHTEIVPPEGIDDALEADSALLHCTGVALKLGQAIYAYPAQTISTYQFTIVV